MDELSIMQDDDRQWFDYEQRLSALDELRAIERRAKIAVALCSTDDEWLNCLRQIAFDMGVWEQEHGAL